MKKIKVNMYADAFVAALHGAGAKEKLIGNFIESIRKHNDWSRRHQILAAVEKKWRRAQGKSLITIESARALSKDQEEQLGKRWKDKNSDIEYTTNPSLIAGAKIVINEERQLDGSLKRKLAELFSKIKI